MIVTGAMRVKNEARWIKRSIESILPVCDSVVVFDDHSTDGTQDICRALPRVTVVDSLFSGLDEVRDKNALLEYVRLTKSPDWVVMIDGDEVLWDRPRLQRTISSAKMLRGMMETTAYHALAFPILYLWDREDQIRVDGVYRQMSRVSAFQPRAHRFTAAQGQANFHCGNAPQSIYNRGFIDTPLLHFGYMDRADRLRKFHWYRKNDPSNLIEDEYRHIVQGDVPEVPALKKLKHAGPLELKRL